MSVSVLTSIAQLPGKQFRTMLRVLSRGLHLVQASALLQHRSNSGCDLVTDDVNSVLSSYAFYGVEYAITAYLIRTKRDGRLEGRPDEELVDECRRVMTTWDMGELSNLDMEQYRRSPAIHAAAAERKRKGGAGAGAAAAAAAAAADSTSDGAASPPPAKRAKVADSDTAGSGGASCTGSDGSGGSAAAAAPLVQAKGAATTAAAVQVLHDPSSETFKRVSELLKARFCGNPESEPAAARARWSRAWRLFCCLRLPPAVAAAMPAELTTTSTTTTTSASASSSASSSSSSSSNSSSGSSDEPVPVPGSIALEPNARTFILLLYTCVEAGHVTRGRALLQLLYASGLCSQDTLYQVAQPAFIRRLIDMGICDPSPSLLNARVHSPKWCFLVAAAAASKGDQHGSKHGAVLCRDSRFLAYGHNHRFGVPHQQHIRVMHAEVHALAKLAAATAAPAATGAAAGVADVSVRSAGAAAAAAAAAAVPVTTPSASILPSLAAAVRGAECWVVELDGAGVGYEEAVPCMMCNKGLHALGLAAAHYSAHNGVDTDRVSAKAHLNCETLHAALQRVYPEGIADPEAGAGADALAAAVAAALAGGEDATTDFMPLFEGAQGGGGSGAGTAVADS